MLESRILYKYLFEGVLFLLTIVLLFNMLTDFSYKLGVVVLPLPMAEMQYFGYLSTFLALLNLLSSKFFGFTLLHVS